MSVNDHTRWIDSAGAYVLGAMPPAEREEFETHLESCPECREEVDELRPAAEALPMASPPVLPPPALKDRVMAEVEREAALLARAGPDADRPEPAREKRRRGGWAWLSGWRLVPAAAALVVAGVLAVSLIGGSGTRTYQFEGKNAELRVKDDQATLVAENLPEPPEGKVYEVWMMPKGSDTPQPTNVLFTPRGDGAATAAIPGDVSDVRQVLVTAEPIGGSDTPTSDPIMTATLS